MKERGKENVRGICRYSGPCVPAWQLVKRATRAYAFPAFVRILEAGMYTAGFKSDGWSLGATKAFYSSSDMAYPYWSITVLCFELEC